VTSKERIKRTVHFETPDRTSFCFMEEVPNNQKDISKFFPHFNKKEKSELQSLLQKHSFDICQLHLDAAKENKFTWESGLEAIAKGKIIEDFFVDEWRITWRKDNFPTAHPLANWEKWRDYHIPDPHARHRFARAEKIIRRRKDKYLLAWDFLTIFERMWMLRGFSKVFVDPYLYPKEFLTLRDTLVEYNMAIVEEWAKRDVDGIFFSDDWGGQKGLLINPEDWRKYYKPAYKEIFGLVRAKGLDVFLHSDGDISAIIPDLIECGVNVIHPVQPGAMDLRQLGEKYTGKLCFWGGIDCQKTLVRGTPHDIREEVCWLKKTLGTKKGGYIGGIHSFLPGVPKENILALYQAFLES